MNECASALRLLPLVFAGLLGACGRDGEAKAPQPARPVLTAPVEVEAARLFGPFAGTIAPRYTTNFSFQISGRLVARDVFVGDIVRKGQRLAALDTRLQHFQLASARAALLSAEAQFINAQEVEHRAKSLLATGASTQARVDTTVANLASARAGVDQAKSSLVAAQNQLAYTSLEADYDGVVTATSADVGQVVSAGQTIVTVARPDVREAEFSVPDSMIDRVRPDGVFHIALLADPSVTTTGKVREIEPSSDPATRTRRIRLSLDVPPGAFRLGSTIEISLEESIEPRVVVPATAVFEDGAARAAVWVADRAAGKVGKVAVKVIEQRDDRVVLEAKLATGERVVVAGVHNLAEGQRVTAE